MPTMVLAVATRDTAKDPIAYAANLHYATRDAMVPCGACGLPIHRDRSRNPSGTIRAGSATCNGEPVCKVCAPAVLAGDAATLAPRFTARRKVWSAVRALWAEREARESK